jgi:micrococcal nuclease
VSGRHVTPAAERLANPEAVLTRSDLAELGWNRRGVDAILRGCPVVAIPGYSRPVVLVRDYRAFLEANTYREIVSSARHEIRRRARALVGRRRSLAAVVVIACSGLAATPTSASGSADYRIARVVDGDTVDLANGQRVRLVQIDTPEVSFGVECYGPQASATTRRLLPAGTRVQLVVEPETDRVDDYGRLLRYVIRSDGVNVNLRLVALGAAAPYFYAGRRGRYAARLEQLAHSAKRAGLGLWRACPRTRYDPYRQVDTRS